jgi:hypothetical protein
VRNGEDVIYSQPATINKSPGDFLRGSVVAYRAGALAAPAGYRSPGVWECATDGPLMVGQDRLGTSARSNSSVRRTGQLTQRHEPAPVDSFPSGVTR